MDAASPSLTAIRGSRNPRSIGAARSEEPGIRCPLTQEFPSPRRQSDIERRLTGSLWHQGIKVNQRADALRDLGRDAGCHHAAIGVAHEDDIGELTEANHSQSVFHMQIRGDSGMGKMGTSAQSGQSWSMDSVASGTQQWNHPLPSPATVPPPVDEDDFSHPSSPSP